MKIKSKKSAVNFEIPYISIEVKAKSPKNLKEKTETLNHLVKACTSIKGLGIVCEEVFYNKKTVTALFTLNSGEDFSKKVNTIKKKLQTAIDTLD